MPRWSSGTSSRAIRRTAAGPLPSKAVPSRAVTSALTALLLGAVLVAGCSDDDGGGGDSTEPEAAPFVEAIRQSFTTQQPGELFFAYSDEEATCIAETTIDALGLDFIAENGITADALAAAPGLEALGVSISPEQAEDAAGAMSSCDISYGNFYTGRTGSETVVACIDDGVDPELVAEATAARYQGDQPTADGLLAPISGIIGACVAAG